MRFARTLPLVAAAALAASLLSGCGAERAAGVDVASAAEATAAKKTARVTMTISMDGIGLPSGLKLKGTGVTSLTEPKLDLTFDLSQLLGIAGVLTGTDLKLRVDGASLYIDPPDVPTLDIPDGWLAVDLRKAVDALGIDPDAAAALFQIDCASLLRTLKSTGALKEVGHEKIDGADTTHYKGAYSVEDVLQALPPDRRDATRHALDQLDKLHPEMARGSEKTPIELWIDSAQIVRRTKSSSTLYTPSGVVAVRMSMQTDLSDFGAELDVSRPDDATDVTDRIVGLLDHRD